MKAQPITIYLIALMITLSSIVSLQNPRSNAFYVVTFIGLLLGVVVSMWKSNSD